MAPLADESRPTRTQEEFADVAVEGNPDGGAAPRRGAFEVVTEDGQVLFSRLEAGRLPCEQEVLVALRQLHTPEARDDDGDGAGCRI